MDSSVLPAWITALAGAIAIISRFAIDPLLSVTISGIVVILSSVFVIIGHVTGAEVLYKWFGENPGMSVETAIIVIVIGAGKITMAYYIRQNRKKMDEVSAQIEVLIRRRTPLPIKLPK